MPRCLFPPRCVQDKKDAKGLISKREVFVYYNPENGTPYLPSPFVRFNMSNELPIGSAFLFVRFPGADGSDEFGQARPAADRPSR